MAGINGWCRGRFSGPDNTAGWSIGGVDGMKIAISGAGVAGPALAHWLHRTGHEPTLIERAPRFRTGGYVIDFWGVGYQVAQRMGIEAAIREAGYQVQSIRSIGPPPSTPQLSTTSKPSSATPLPRSPNTPTA